MDRDELKETFHRVNAYRAVSIIAAVKISIGLWKTFAPSAECVWPTHSS